MMPTTRRKRIGTALVVLAVVLFVIPAFFPVQTTLVHDTRPSVRQEPDELRDQGFEVVAYGNLSERGQELYVKTLENNGEYRVEPGLGAPEFDYASSSGFRGDVVIERPDGDAGLPPADERFGGPPREEEGESEPEERPPRYDAMRTGTEQPDLGALPQLLRLAAAMLAVLSMGVGGYLLSSK